MLGDGSDTDPIVDRGQPFALTWLLPIGTTVRGAELALASDRRG
jgi:hypothetical protein